MFRKLTLIAALAALSVVGAASASNGNKADNGKVRYSFLGVLTTAPSNGGVSINVEGGNKPALRKMLGQPVTQTFAYGSSTEFLTWSNGIPTVVHDSDLHAGEYVWVHVRAPRHADLSAIEHVDAGLVGDHGTQLYKPDKPLYLFRGKLASTGSGSVTVDVTGGNQRALRLLVGSGRTQSFSVGDSTIYLVWNGKVPTVIDQSKLTVGDRVVVRVRAAAHSTLAQVTGTAAVKVAEHEPLNARD
jgi:hypothetical protein